MFDTNPHLILLVFDFFSALIDFVCFFSISIFLIINILLYTRDFYNIYNTFKQENLQKILFFIQFKTELLVMDAAVMDII